ncbi:lytic transglycosylase [Wenyingzhuangia aestuarii]|uniref:lytic transglycosylase n=1 Tax=Wenyingzhuangia aestuarii TaxID=1647582 RepID=UPI00143B4FFC|nr:LysM peptidoglycan-binding domain-containing protein [Wenyingzhuangia aestuarii]NJB82331.1 LysM repeat protein [Wenyingzhuangia aestuarii]
MIRVFKVFSLLFVMISLSISAQELKEYKVKRGESLKDIAEKFDVSYTDLLKANPEIPKKPKKRTLVKIPARTFKSVKHPKDARPNASSDYFKLPTQENDSIGIHKVQAKETLYSLSKQYNVSMATLIKQNPFLAVDGLKIGQELQVPVAVKKPVDKEKATFHTVIAQETLYGISKQYGVSISELKNANTEVLKEGLKLGTVLKIPTVTQQEVVTDPSKHIIAQGETLYSVSRKYGISVPELLAVNDTVVIDSLVIGSAIKLPSKVIAKVTESTVSPIYKRVPLTYQYNQGDSLQMVLEELGISKDSLQSINPSFDSILENGGNFLVGLKKTHLIFEDHQWFKDSIVVDKVLNTMIMLPFNFKKNDTLSQETLFANPSGLPSIVSDFYLGAQMAIDSLQKQGIKINLSVVDTEKSVDSIHKKMESIRALDPDVIIGPLYTNNTMYVATQFPSVPVYYPIYSQKQNRFRNSNIIKTATHKDLLEKEVLSFIQENRKGEHLIIVGNSQNMATLKKYKSLLAKRDSSGAIIEDDVSLLTLSKGYISRQDFLSKLKLEQANWILIAENSNVITADVFNNTRSIPRSNVLETPIRVLSFEKSGYANKISFETLAKYHYTYGTDEVEYIEVKNNSFENAYAKKNNVFPNDYAIKGFNVTYDAILRTVKGNSKDASGASHRYRQAFYYDKNGKKVNDNQAVFVNAIENSKEEGLRIIRLR